MNNILDALHWRYATKKFDNTKKLTQEKVDDILEAIRLAPSSYGLQPYRIFVITNEELREKLKPAGYNQSAFGDASHLLIFTVPTNFSETNVDDYLKEVVATRNVTLESLQGYKDMMMGLVKNSDAKKLEDWAARQVYLALGQLLLIAALEKIDAVPMEGFKPNEIDEILELKEKNLTTVVVAGLGYRSEDDAYAKLAKVRTKKENLFIELN